METSRNLRLILGLKLRNLRLARSESLKSVADRAGVSVSYLSELEQGKKYPKPDKLLRLAAALAVDYDDLVSSTVTDELGPLKEAVSSGFLREFPFELFGLEREDLVRLIADAPDKAGPLIQSLVDIGRSYDVQVEHFLLSALRSYQQMHANYFGELERAASELRHCHSWSPGSAVDESQLTRLLIDRWGYQIDTETISSHPDLGSFRSVYVEGESPVLHVNGRLRPVQRAFVLAREVGYRTLDLYERATTSSWIKIESFAQVLNNFKASYFAGALLLDRETVVADIRSLFAEPSWSPQDFRKCMERFCATPEMFLYRLTELLPQIFGLEKLFFVRFHERTDSTRVALTKVFNLSGVPVPYGVGLKEHYCRRWPGVELLLSDPDSTADSALAGTPTGSGIAVQRSRFFDQEAEFFVIASSRTLALDPAARSSVSIGLLMDRSFRKAVRFWDDPAVPRVDVHLTCERCPLTAKQCADRVAPATLYQSQLDRERQERALEELVGGIETPARAGT